MKKNLKNKLDNRKSKYFIYILIALLISTLIFLLFKFLIPDDTKEAKEEIANTVEEFSKAALNIGHKLTIKEILSEDYNYKSREEACKKALEYMLIGKSRRSDVCQRAANLRTSLAESEANASFVEKVIINDIQLNSKEDEADIRVSLEITMQTGKNVISDYSEKGPLFEIRTTKEPLKFDNLKLSLVKKEDKWLIDNDKDFIRELSQLYSLWIASDNMGEAIIVPYEDNNIEMLRLE